MTDMDIKNNGYDFFSTQEELEMNDYCERYKDYLNLCKTERLCVEHSVSLAKAAGFQPYEPGVVYSPGDKIYWTNREKNLFLAVIGKKSLAHGANISIAHADSPRLDVGPRPVEEDGGLSYFRTYLYGWVRKHQWLARPLSIQGVVYRSDGSRCTVSIGENPDEPKFMVTDLLPHLSSAQNRKPLGEAYPNENMRIVIGSRPLLNCVEHERIKAYALQLIREKYCIEEKDFLSAELEIVPVGSACDIGLDRSLIASYGQDDRVCAFAQLSALFEIECPEKTAVCAVIDKEEVNSDGVTGMKSGAFDHFMKQLCRAQGVEIDDCFANSFCISADVTAAYDAGYSDVFDTQTSAFINRGVAVSKYTGHDGDKSDASDASAEVISKFRTVVERNNIIWQMNEMGRPLAGGGGTIAKFMANRNIDTLDVGVPVLSMHAPYEITSKLDCFMTYRAIRAVFSDCID